MTVVLVTGCSTGGIGYALCEEFARQGCRVYATSRRVGTMADFASESVEKLALDVTRDEDVQKVVDYIVAKEGTIDVVVNNAGVSIPGPIVDQSLDSVKQVFDTNAFSILRLCRAVVPIMAKRKAGTIVNIGSIMGEICCPWTGVYCASKAAIKSISEVLYMELKPFGINVLHVAPGAVKSNIATNGANCFRLPENTLYVPYLANMFDWITISQDSLAIDSDVFARKVVTNALKECPPRYMTLGGRSTLFALLTWLPRRLVLYFMWRRFSRST